MPPPVDVGADYAAAVDGLECVTLESLDPDSGETLAEATPQALASKEVQGEQGVGEGGVGYTTRDFTILAAGLAFTPKARDRVTTADGVKWVLGPDVTAGGFGSLYHCRGCTRERTP